MAIAAGKGPKAQKIGLKEQAPALVQRISHRVSLQIAVGVTAARRRARGGDCAASQPRVLPPVPVPTPSGEERAAERPSSTTPANLPRLLTHDPHRDHSSRVRRDHQNPSARQRRLWEQGQRKGERLLWLELLLARQLTRSADNGPYGAQKSPARKANLGGVYIELLILGLPGISTKGIATRIITSRGLFAASDHLTCTPIAE